MIEAQSKKYCICIYLANFVKCLLDYSMTLESNQLCKEVVGFSILNNNGF